MNLKSLVSAATAAALVSGIGFAYAQTTDSTSQTPSGTTTQTQQSPTGSSMDNSTTTTPSSTDTSTGSTTSSPTGTMSESELAAQADRN